MGHERKAEDDVDARDDDDNGSDHRRPRAPRMGHPHRVMSAPDIYDTLHIANA
jgi:hypothetical protein